MKSRLYALQILLTTAALCVVSQRAQPQPAMKRVYTFFQNAITERDNLPPANLGAWHFIALSTSQLA
jgi:hypothetical protein